ncbi:CsgE family curli-type amyloid fiber assembly protein [Solimonas sp. K1W22B-7]|uniref:CsgE family curli-type amyloid fiber assembly protein n=1 Tax=Solimonas sp. K1W22B-7 TaxID=2303331 RepID=UPI0013C4EBAF|nr:CsgE family curli-type amyloid fiber assembly protein [Solimonas sp. K1W22B-7]
MGKGLLAALLCAGLLLSPAQAADIDIPGVLTNETRTFAGREFYDAFVESWQALDPDGQYGLVVSEKPAARLGCQMSVSYRGSLLYQRFIGFNGRVARAAALDAARRVHQSVMASELDSMAGDSELRGDGL